MKTWRFNKKHILYYKGYAYERNNRIHLSILGRRQSTGLAWDERNRARAMQLLESKIVAELSSTSDMTVQNYWNEWKRLNFKDKTPETAKKYTYAMKHFITENVKMDFIELQEHIADNVKKCGLATSTINRELTMLRTIFRYAVDTNMLLKNPVVDSIIPKSRNQEMVVFSNAEIRHLIDRFRASYFELSLLIEFIWITGVRINEAINIKMSDVGADSITINGKGHRLRYIPTSFNPRIEGIVSNLVQIDPKRIYLFKWTNSRGVANIVRRSLKKWEKYESQKMFHAIRRRAVNNMIESGVNIQTAAAILGHTIQVMQWH